MKSISAWKSSSAGRHWWMLWTLHGHERVWLLKGNGAKVCCCCNALCLQPAYIHSGHFEGSAKITQFCLGDLQCPLFAKFLTVAELAAWCPLSIVWPLLFHRSTRKSWRSSVSRQSRHALVLDVSACLLPGQPFTSSTSSAVWVLIGLTQTLTLVPHTPLFHRPRISVCA